MRHAEGRLLVQRAVGGNYMISTMRKSQHPNIVCSIHRIHQCFGDCFFTVSQKYISCVHIHILYYIIKSYQMYDYVSLYIDKWHNMSRGPSTCQPSRFNCLVNNCIVSLRCHPTWLIGKSSIKQMEVSIGKSKIIYIYIYTCRTFDCHVSSEGKTNQYHSTQRRGHAMSATMTFLPGWSLALTHLVWPPST